MRTIYWRDGFVLTVDQTKLPRRLSFIKLRSYGEVADAIKRMKIRGAPLIGVAGALGLALTAFHSKARSRKQLMEELETARDALLARAHRQEVSGGPPL